MATTIQQVPPNEIEKVLPLLLLAEPSERALRWGLQHLSDTVYRMEVDSELVGAASIRWRDEPCEIEEIGIVPERQGQGLGKQMLRSILQSAQERGDRSMTRVAASAVLFGDRVSVRHVEAINGHEGAGKGVEGFPPHVM